VNARRPRGSAGGAAATLGPLAAGSFVALAFVLAGPIAPMGIATAACGVLTLAGLALSPGARWPRTPVDAAMLAWLAALVLAAVFAVDPAGSARRVTKGLFPLLVGLAAFHGADPRTGRRALAAFLAGTAVAAAFGLAVWGQHGASFAHRARGFSGHYMTYAGMLLLALPVALGVALRAREARWRWSAAAVAVLALSALAATYTRSAWLGLFASGAVLLGFTWPPGLVGLAAAGVAAWFLAPGAFGERLRSSFDPTNAWNRERWLMWQAGLAMWRDHPLTGVGLMDLHALYDRYRLPGATERVGHLHNAFVQILATTGAIGLAAFAWLVAMLLRSPAAGLVRQLRERRGDGVADGLRLGVLAALVGFLVAGAFEWNFGDEELLYPLFTLAGLAWAAREWPAEEGAA
jgi:O-antigen ligase